MLVCVFEEQNVFVSRKRCYFAPCLPFFPITAHGHGTSPTTNNLSTITVFCWPAHDFLRHTITNTFFFEHDYVSARTGLMSLALSVISISH